MLVLLLKASFIIAVLLVFYKIFLERESFFGINRIYLLASLAFAFALPFISLPEMINQQGYVSNLIENIEETRQEVAVPLLPQNAITKETNIESEAISPKIAPSSSSIVPQRSLVDWLVLIYFFGIIVFLLNLIVQILSILLKVVRSTDKIEDEGYIIVNTTDVKEPCSFFKYIFINPESYDFDTYEQILKHEKIHVIKRHSIDLMLSELAVILLWFNPLIWLWRKEVEKNIEYQTDDLLLERKTVKRELYQMNLLKVATYTRPLSITTNYNQSLLKQRIMKMNTKKSNVNSYWKYAFMAPVLFATLLLVNKPITAFAQAEISQAPVKENWKWTEMFKVWESEETLDQEIGDKEDWENDNESSLEEESQRGIENEYENSVSFDKPNYTDLDNEATKNQTESVVDFLFSTEGCRNLLKAVKRGSIDDVSDYLKEASPNCTYRGDGEPRSPLVAAARQGYYEIGKLLVAADGDVEYNSAGDESPLMAASIGGHLDFAELMIENGADVNRKVEGDGTALLVASGGGHLETVAYLLEAGADVNATVGGDGTALIQAVRNRKVDVAEILLEAGADPYLNVPGDEYPMYHARQSGNEKMIELLKEYEK